MGVAAIAAGTVGTFSGGAAPAKAASDPITFGTPTILDPIHTYGEPNVGINPVDGSVYDSGPQGTGVQRSGWEGSVDGGATSRIVGQCTGLTNFVGVTQSCPLMGGPNGGQDQETTTAAPGGGDADQRFDSKGTQYFTDLYALVCDRVAYTTDDGATAPENFTGCGNTTPTCGTTTNPTPCPGEGSDRPWMAVVDPGFLGQSKNASPYGQSTGATFPVVYEEYNNLQTVQANCSDWVMSGNPGNPTTNLNYEVANNTSNGNFGCDGYPSVDQVYGVVLEASSCGSGNVCLNIGEPEGTSAPTPGYLCFLDTPASDPGCPDWPTGGNDFGKGLITVASGLPDDTADLFIVSSLDSGRNLHVFFGVDDSSSQTTASNVWQMWTTVASPGDSRSSAWRTWAKPVQVSDGSATTGDAVNIMPWGVAGAPGRSDMVWYGNGDTAEGPSSTSPGNQIWNVFMSQTVWPVDANNHVTGAAPTVNGSTAGSNPTVSGDFITTTAPVTVTPHPMQYGGICLLGTGCITAQGNRNVADFFEVNIDKNGAAVISYDDTADNILQNNAPASEEAADHHGAAVITYGRQDGGPGLYGPTTPGVATPGTDVPGGCSGPSLCPWSLSTPNYQSATPTTGMSDPTGDGKYPVIGGTNLPALDLTGNKLDLSSDNSTLTVTMNVNSLSTTDIDNAFTTIPAAGFFTYVTRWLMVPPGIQKSACEPGATPTPETASCSMYYAMAEVTPGGTVFSVAAGLAQSIDLCSVSACFPHVIYYSEGTTGTDGGHSLPSSDYNFDQTHNTITINVPAADVGSPTQTSLLEEVGSYTLASDHGQEAVTNGQAQTDDVPFEVDGICCFNFMGNQSPAQIPETPWTPALIAIGGALLASGVVIRRRRGRQATPEIGR